MDIRVEIFTEGDSSEYKASRAAQAKFNDFAECAPIGRIVSITTNTTHSMTPSQDTWFVYTLTLVYEPRTEVPKPEDITPVDDPTKELF